MNKQTRSRGLSLACDEQVKLFNDPPDLQAIWDIIPVLTHLLHC